MIPTASTDEARAAAARRVGEAASAVIDRPSLTKVLATLGPATDEPDAVRQLVEAGASLFRLNFSHGTFDDHAKRLAMVREVSARLNRPLAVLGDLPGPKLRVGEVPGEGIELTTGELVEIRGDAERSAPASGGGRTVLASRYERVAQEVEPGHRVLINDGAVRLLAVERTPDGALLCRVTTGGLVTTGKGLNLPDSELTVPAITERDWEIVEWSVRAGLDFLALSFVRRADEVRELRERLRELCLGGACGTTLDERGGGPAIPVIAKIETPQAVERMQAVIAEADGVMIARGDLGVELDVAQVPMVQKRLVDAAHAAGKPVIVATQMLESMIERANPTRAEVSDVANAILDGADCVMLSGETAVGKYPALAVETMRRVALAVEAELRSAVREPKAPSLAREQREVLPALAHGAWQIAQDVDAQAVVIWSQTGAGARHLSRLNFDVPIIAFSSDETAVRRMTLLYAVIPVLWLDVPEHRSVFARCADEFIIGSGWIGEGEPLVLMAGKPLDAPGSTNTVSVRFAGDLCDTEV